MRGCFKCSRKENGNIMLNCYLPKSQIKMINKIENNASASNFVDTFTNFHLPKSFPFYLAIPLSEPGVVYTIDSSEHEHLERYLAGTDDPLYDFVHEIRYNPAWVGGDVKKAQAHFAQAK